MEAKFTRPDDRCGNSGLRPGPSSTDSEASNYLCCSSLDCFDGSPCSQSTPGADSFESISLLPLSHCSTGTILSFSSQTFSDCSGPLKANPS